MVLDQGRMVGFDSHTRLLATCQTYGSLVSQTVLVDELAEVLPPPSGVWIQVEYQPALSAIPELPVGLAGREQPRVRVESDHPPLVEDHDAIPRSATSRSDAR